MAASRGARVRFVRVVVAITASWWVLDRAGFFSFAASLGAWPWVLALLVAVTTLISTLGRHPAFTRSLLVWFWKQGLLVMDCSILVVASCITVYLTYRRYGEHASQWTDEKYAAAVRSVRHTRLFDSTGRLAWATLNSSIMDVVVIASWSMFLSLWRTFKLGGHRGLQFLLTLMFYIPNKLWACIAILGGLLVIGGVAIAFFVFAYVQAACGEAAGKDFEKRQRREIEANMGTYQPLRRGQIRVLRLLPGRPGDPLRCELEPVELAEARYEALSYVWGHTTRDRKIQTAGRQTWITRNLYRALSYLRHETDTRVLWADALCINQTDNDERQQQVSQMHDIYHLASRTIIWLGNAPFGLGKVFEAAQHNEPLARHHYGSVRVVAQLLRAPWWTRVWVVQELIVSRDVVVKCSDHELDWERFRSLADSAIASPLFPAEGTHAREYRVLEQQRRAMSLASSKADLLQLLYIFRRKPAAMERDKIFAFLGLSNVVRIEAGVEKIQPDYEAESDDVFRDYGIKFINASGSLAIMALSECIEIGKWATWEQKEKLTWCPDWASSGNDFDATPFWLGEIRNPEGSPPWSSLDYSAAGGLPAPKCATVGNLVRLEGWEADEIIKVGRRTTVLPKDLAEMMADRKAINISTLFLVLRDWTSVIPMWQSLAREFGGPALDRSDTDRAFYTTITAGVYRDGKPSGAEEEEFMRTVRAACYGRRLFVTASGRLGLGPSHTEVGNKVFILLGSNVPMVLRVPGDLDYSKGIEPTPSKSGSPSPVYLNVGQAYVDDLMRYRGDLKKDLEEGRQVADYVYLL